MKAIRKVSIFTKLRVLTGGLKLLVTSFAFWVFLIATIALTYNSALILVGNTWVAGEATIINIEETEIKEEKEDNKEEEKITYDYKYTISYTLADKDYENNCYAYGLEEKSTYKEKLAVPIEYSVQRPQYARIVGTDAVPHALWVPFFTMVLMLITLAAMLQTLWDNYQALQLLQYGVLTKGTLDKKEETSGNVGDNKILKYFFTFLVEDKPYTATGMTHKYELIEDEPTKSILYHPENPNKAIIYATAHHLPPIDKQGNLIRQSYFFSFLGYLILQLIGLFALFVTLVLVQ